jgi:predicted nucleic acid-binding protein
MLGNSGLIAEVFLDTNVIVCAACGHDETPAKQQTAERLLLSDFGTSGQVLAEFYTVLTRRAGGRLQSVQAQALSWLRQLARKPCQAIDAPLVLAATDLSSRYQIAYWDAAIVAAAERLGARVLFTESLSHGQTYGSVTVVNPFLET